MIKQYLPRIVQSIIAIPLLVLTIIYWNLNKIGQNLLNLTTVSTYLIGIEYILLFYAWIFNQETFNYEITLLIVVIFIMGQLFEKFHPTDINNFFNTFSTYNLIAIIALNILFIALFVLIIIAYTFRQIYRLMTDSLLNTTQNLSENQKNEILKSTKKFRQILLSYQEVNVTCSICIGDFQQQNDCILLPECNHCFHKECIESWLENKSTCPYCRNNIRLSLI